MTQYSKRPLRRRHAPRRPDNYLAYRSCLRDEFAYTCVYCLASEMLVGAGYHHGGFQVEHFKPKSKYPALERDYGNLMWACPDCNNAKGQQWPLRRVGRGGKRWVDPTREALAKHMLLSGERVDALTPTGEWIIDRLRLNEPIHLERRRKRAAVVSRLAQLRTTAIACCGDEGVVLAREIALLESSLHGPPWDPVVVCLCSVR